jgi:hypothetical protein
MGYGDCLSSSPLATPVNVRLAISTTQLGALSALPLENLIKAGEVWVPGNYQSAVVGIVDVVGAERHLHGGLVLEGHASVLLEGIQPHAGRRARYDCDFFPIGGQREAVGKRDALGHGRGAQLARRKVEVNRPCQEAASLTDSTMGTKYFHGAGPRRVKKWSLDTRMEVGLSAATLFPAQSMGW